MANPVRSRIQIRGGASGVTYTSLRRAETLVDLGRAQWCADGSAIRMIGEADPVVNGYWYERIDRDMRRQELREVPFAGDIDRLYGELPRPRKAGKNGPVKIVTRAGITCIENARLQPV